MSTTKFRVRLAFVITWSLAAMLIHQQANATSIKKCSTIKKPGFYSLNKDLSTNGGDCLIVKARNVTLSLGGHNITGAGSDIGLHVMSTATNFRCDGGNFTNFAIGVEDDADGATIENTDSEANTDTGVLVNGATQVTVGSASAKHNGKYGYHLLSASYTMVHNYEADSNGTYGVFVQASDHTLLENFRAGDYGADGIAGVYIGCSEGGPGGICATGPSNFNVVSHGSQQTNQYGLVVDAGSGNNVLADTLEAGNINFDVFDGNANCGTNLWFFDAFRTSNNPACMNQE
jgi:hypothetical protein